MVQLPTCEGDIRISQNLMKTLKNHISWMDYPFLSKFWMFIAKKYSTFNEFVFFSEYSVLLNIQGITRVQNDMGRWRWYFKRLLWEGARHGVEWINLIDSFHFNTLEIPKQIKTSIRPWTRFIDSSQSHRLIYRVYTVIRLRGRTREADQIRLLGLHWPAFTQWSRSRSRPRNWGRSEASSVFTLQNFAR